MIQEYIVEARCSSPPSCCGSTRQTPGVLGVKGVNGIHIHDCVDDLFGDVDDGIEQGGHDVQDAMHNQVRSTGSTRPRFTC